MKDKLLTFCAGFFDILAIVPRKREPYVMLTSKELNQDILRLLVDSVHKLPVKK